MRNQFDSLFSSVAVISLMIGASSGNSTDNKLAQTNTIAQRAIPNVPVDYIAQDDWGSDFVVNVTITNKSGSAINDWSPAWTFPGDQQITNTRSAGPKRGGEPTYYFISAILS